MLSIARFALFLFPLISLGAVAGPTAAQAREVVAYNAAAPGTIVIKTNERRLYYITGDGRAISYRVGVGRKGKQWSGETYISGKHLKPAWTPPMEVRMDKPNLPQVIPGGVPSNPMGAAALTLAGDEYAIHGTNDPSSIGGFVSYGCIRMYNQDVVDLFGRVQVGTRVIVQ